MMLKNHAEESRIMLKNDAEESNSTWMLKAFSTIKTAYKLIWRWYIGNCWFENGRDCGSSLRREVLRRDRHRQDHFLVFGFLLRHFKENVMMFQNHQIWDIYNLFRFLLSSGVLLFFMLILNGTVLQSVQISPFFWCFAIFLCWFWMALCSCVLLRAKCGNSKCRDFFLADP